MGKVFWGGNAKAAYTTALNPCGFRHTRNVAKPIKPHAVVGRNIVRIRAARDMTQEKLAERLDIDRRSLQRIEAGSWNMTIDYLDRFRRALRCSWADLLDRLDD